ncbi:DUF3916 domain-containing protein [Thiomicrorhabdus indica]|uniref:DUF3916 domain-containing protein n=1 Tax=Thiomicrorhabdus indica TaxID=2267253 RepID=UPI00102DE601|nr:DUF3916 domain-containing protein [Thiomicrorhabdus indica]
MRQISFNRPKQKVRGSHRRLKALDAWAGQFEGYFPLEYSDERYIDYKIPVLDRLVDPPTTTKEWQNRAIAAMFKAYENLHSAKPSEFLAVNIDLILTWPDLHGSSIIIFFDESYREGFYEKDNEWQKRIPQTIGLEGIPFDVPKSIDVQLVNFMNRDYDGEETTDWYTTNWYVCASKNC